MAEARAQEGLPSIVSSLIEGEINLEHAVELASAEGVADELTLDFVAAAGNSGRKAAASGKWRGQVVSWRFFLRILSPQAEAHPEDVRFQVAVADYIFIVTEALKEIADARMLRHAVEQGEQAISLARAAGLGYWIAIQTSRLGALHILPYVGSLGEPSWEAAVARWQYRGRDAYPGENPVELTMPKPEAALRTAESYLEASLATGANAHEGFTHKLLAQALQYRLHLGDDTADPAALVAHARAALELLPRDEAEWRAEAASMLERHGGGVAPAQDHDVSSLGESLARLRILRAKEPELSCDLAERLWSAGIESESERLEVLRYYLEGCWHLVAPLKLFPSGVVRIFKSPGQQFERAREKLSAQLATGSGPPDRFRALLGLAVRSSEHDTEPAAMEMVEEALAGEQDRARREIARAFFALISVDHGATAWKDMAYEEAASRYLEATEHCTNAGLGTRARETFARALDAIGAAGFPAEPRLLSALHGAGLAIEATGGEGQVARSLRACWDRLIGSAFSAFSPPASIIFAMMQMAKGASFARLLQQVHTLRATDVPELRSALKAIEKTGSPPGTGAVPDDGAQEYVLNAIDDEVSLEGRTPAERSANLQRKFDKRLRQHLLSSSESSRQPAMLEEAAQLLDNRTVLLTVYSGRSADQEAISWGCTLTKDLQVSLAVMNSGPSLQVQFGLTVGGGVLDDLALFVAGAREHVRTNPGRMRSVVPEGAEDLRALRQMLLGGLESTLATLRGQGFDHLVICAHGSTHFLPWHLLLADDSPLADGWTVTYLPTVDLLRRRESRTGRKSAYAIGLSFDGDEPHGQRALPEVARELEAIASVTNARVLIDGKATEKSLERCFGSARWVHIATHGRHQVAAPAFQALFLTPAGGSDGVLNAFELLAFDLSEVELVTLSACESALGRIDIGDNLRGLPAALFQAGVQTIIGTLWEVNSEVSAFFFSRLYERLAGGDSRVEAFAAAQGATRERYPAFFHWGAFHYAGAW